MFLFGAYLFLSDFAVFKFVEHPENNENVLQKCKVKFKILSLKVKGPMEYAPELVSRFFFLAFLIDFHQVMEEVSFSSLVTIGSNGRDFFDHCL
jgi:hypothetical protein